MHVLLGLFHFPWWRNTDSCDVFLSKAKQCIYQHFSAERKYLFFCSGIFIGSRATTLRGEQHWLKVSFTLTHEIYIYMHLYGKSPHDVCGERTLADGSAEYLIGMDIILGHVSCSLSELSLRGPGQHQSGLFLHFRQPCCGSPASNGHTFCMFFRDVEINKHPGGQPGLLDMNLGVFWARFQWSIQTNLDTRPDVLDSYCLWLFSGQVSLGEAVCFERDILPRSCESGFSVPSDIVVGE